MDDCKALLDEATANSPLIKGKAASGGKVAFDATGPEGIQLLITLINDRQNALLEGLLMVAERVDELELQNRREPT